MHWPVARPWFSIERIDDRLTLIREPHVDPLLRCNIWHLRGRDRDLLVDGGLGLVSLGSEFPELLERRVMAVATHTHLDHVGGLAEFAERAVHEAEAGSSTQRAIPSLLRGADYPPALRRALIRAGYGVAEWLVTAVPSPEFDPASYRQPEFAPTTLITEGDTIDLGDVVFQVVHLPGHSPGSVGLWDARSGTLFSGDAVYDGPLIDTLPGSCIDDYRQTMRRLLDLPVQVVHGGHDDSFGPGKLREMAQAYLESR